jgi:tetratricopeptide (TPR) repeat protein
VSLLVLSQPALKHEARAHTANATTTEAPGPSAAPRPFAKSKDCQSLASSTAAVGSASGTKAAKLFERAGAQCVKAGALSVAVAHYSAAIRQTVWRASTFARRGESYAGLGEHEFAVLDYDQSIRLAPDRARYRYLRAVSLAAIGRAEAAVDDLEHVLKLDDREVVSKLQRHLAKKGYDTPVDGEYDLETRRDLVACLSRNCISL